MRVVIERTLGAMKLHRAVRVEILPREGGWLRVGTARFAVADIEVIALGDGLGFHPPAAIVRCVPEFVDPQPDEAALIGERYEASVRAGWVPGPMPEVA